MAHKNSEQASGPKCASVGSAKSATLGSTRVLLDENRTGPSRLASTSTARLFNAASSALASTTFSKNNAKWPLAHMNKLNDEELKEAVRKAEINPSTELSHSKQPVYQVPLHKIKHAAPSQPLQVSTSSSLCWSRSEDVRDNSIIDHSIGAHSEFDPFTEAMSSSPNINPTLSEGCPSRANDVIENSGGLSGPDQALLEFFDSLSYDLDPHSSSFSIGPGAELEDYESDGDEETYKTSNNSDHRHVDHNSSSWPSSLPSSSARTLPVAPDEIPTYASWSLPSSSVWTLPVASRESTTGKGQMNSTFSSFSSSFSSTPLPIRSTRTNDVSDPHTPWSIPSPQPNSSSGPSRWFSSSQDGNQFTPLVVYPSSSKAYGTSHCDDLSVNSCTVDLVPTSTSQSYASGSDSMDIYDCSCDFVGTFDATALAIPPYRVWVQPPVPGVHNYSTALNNVSTENLALPFAMHQSKQVASDLSNHPSSSCMDSSAYFCLSSLHDPSIYNQCIFETSTPGGRFANTPNGFFATPPPIQTNYWVPHENPSASTSFGPAPSLFFEPAPLFHPQVFYPTVQYQPQEPSLLSQSVPFRAEIPPPPPSPLSLSSQTFWCERSLALAQAAVEEPRTNPLLHGTVPISLESLPRNQMRPHRTLPRRTRAHLRGPAARGTKEDLAVRLQIEYRLCQEAARGVPKKVTKRARKTSKPESEKRSCSTNGSKKKKRKICKEPAAASALGVSSPVFTARHRAGRRRGSHDL